MKQTNLVKILIRGVSIVLILIVSMTAQSQGYDEGVHYTIIDQHQGGLQKRGAGDNEVVEYFSFSCAGCYSFESSISALLRTQPSTNFRRVHMPFGGPKAKFSQKAFALIVLLNATKHKDTIFNRIHVERNLFDSDKEIIGFFQKLGYERTLIDQTMQSFTADALIRKMNKEASKLKISSVPSVIVNGKYMINVRSLESTQDLALVVSYLNSLD